MNLSQPENPPLAQVVREVLDGVATPDVRDRVLARALYRAQLTEIPNAAKSLRLFVERQLRMAVADMLGDGVAASVENVLHPILRMAEQQQRGTQISDDTPSPAQEDPLEGLAFEEADPSELPIELAPIEDYLGVGGTRDPFELDLPEEPPPHRHAGRPPSFLQPPADSAPPILPTHRPARPRQISPPPAAAPRSSLPVTLDAQSNAPSVRSQPVIAVGLNEPMLSGGADVTVPRKFNAGVDPEVSVDPDLGEEVSSAFQSLRAPSGDHDLSRHPQTGDGTTAKRSVPMLGESPTTQKVSVEPLALADATSGVTGQTAVATLLLATDSPDLFSDVEIYLSDVVHIVLVEDAIALMDLTASMPSPVLLVDCVSPTVTPATLIAMMPDMPNVTLLLWGLDEQERHDYEALLPKKTHFLRADTGMDELARALGVALPT